MSTPRRAATCPRLIKLPTPEDSKRLGELEIAIAAAKVSGDKKWIEKLDKEKDEYREDASPR